MRISDFSFCSSDPCPSPEGLPKQKQDSGDGEKPTLMARIVKNVKPQCLSRKKKKQQQQKHRKERRQPKIAIQKDLALGFPKSPTMEKKSNSKNGGDRGSKHRAGGRSGCVSNSGKYSTVSLEELLYSSDYDTSVETESVGFSDSRDLSFSLEKLLKDEKKVHEVEEIGLYSLTKSRNVKEKKVSFRLPEASDIIILNSPVVDLK